jgi:lipoyl-dependent peroxiredoxin
MMRRSGHAVWQGTVRDGRGALATPSRVLDDVPYSFATRFGDQAGTNPEELMAAAHAGCYSMALSFLLGAAGLTTRRIQTRAELSIEASGQSWSVTAIHLTVSAQVPGAGEADFQRIAEQARSGCLVTRMLSERVSVTMDARLEASAEPA